MRTSLAECAVFQSPVSVIRPELSVVIAILMWSIRQVMPALVTA